MARWCVAVLGYVPREKIRCIAKLPTRPYIPHDSRSSVPVSFYKNSAQKRAFRCLYFDHYKHNTNLLSEQRRARFEHLAGACRRVWCPAWSSACITQNSHQQMTKNRSRQTSVDLCWDRRVLHVLIEVQDLTQGGLCTTLGPLHMLYCTYQNEQMIVSKSLSLWSDYMLSIRWVRTGSTSDPFEGLGIIKRPSPHNCVKNRQCYLSYWNILSLVPPQDCSLRRNTIYIGFQWSI